MKNPSQRFGERSLAEWADVLRHSPQAEERYRALQAVIALADAASSLELLTHALADADSGVRAGAARRLATLAAAADRPGTDANWTAIGQRWDELLQDADPDVRFEAACGLLRLETNPAAAIGVLLEGLNEPETHPVMLARILSVLIEARPRISGDRIPWQVLLRHPQSEVREQAARAAGVFGTAAGALSAELVPLLDDDEPFVREEAAKSLGELGDWSERIGAALQAASADEDELVAEAARQALRKLQS